MDDLPGLGLLTLGGCAVSWCGDIHGSVGSIFFCGERSGSRCGIYKQLSLRPGDLSLSLNLYIGIHILILR